MHSLFHQPRSDFALPIHTPPPIVEKFFSDNNIEQERDLQVDIINSRFRETLLVTNTNTSISQSSDFGLQFETAYEDAEAFSIVIKSTLERIFDSSTTKDSFSYSNFLLETSTAECNGLFCEASYTITADVDCGGVCTDNIINEIKSTFSEDIENTVSTALSDGTFLEIFIEVSEDLGSDDLLVVANIVYAVTSSPTAAPTFNDGESGNNFGEIIQITASVFIIGIIGLIVAIITVMVSLVLGAIAVYLYNFRSIFVPIPVSEEVGGVSIEL